MSYCLVCLASGTKDPCVRCGHRTSKRVEQLVHLRLKSIYKAFKQGGAALNNRGSSHGNCDSGVEGSNAKGSSSSSGKKNSSHNPGSSDNSSGPISGKRMPEMQGNNDSTTKRAPGVECPSIKGDLGAVLQVTAAAAASAAASTKGSECENSSKGWNHGVMPRGVNPRKVVPHLNHDGSISFRPRKEPKKNDSDLYASRTQAEADAAAAALLAELDEEKQQTEASTKAKKSKKKKKKERQAAREKEKEERAKREAKEKASKLIAETEKKKTGGKDLSKAKLSSGSLQDKNVDSSNTQKSKKKKKKGKVEVVKPVDIKQQSLDDSTNDDSEEDDIRRLAEGTGVDVRTPIINPTPSNDNGEDDDVEFRLAKLISAGDLDGIETVLNELKGVPGRAALRKNAKKAAKRIREEKVTIEEALRVKEEQHDSNKSTNSMSATNVSVDAQNSTASAYKPSEPLLKLVSNIHRVQSTSGGPPRSECVMHMAPSVVGWVIGKGGQRIRDLMEDSGAKVWIDQESMSNNDMRIVYVSGTKKSIDVAVRTIKDLVAKAPVGGSTHGSATNTTVTSTIPHMVNDSASVTSTRSSLTSTPISFSQNVTNHVPTSGIKKPLVSPGRIDHNHHESLSRPSPSNAHLGNDMSSAAGCTLSPPQPIPMPPPGIENSMGAPSEIVPPSGKGLADTGNITPKAVHELTCEPRFVPLLIGRRGWTVKNIQDTSGARVDIDQNVNPRRIIISGDIEQVRKAVRLVREVLSYPHAQLNYDGTSGTGEAEAEIGSIRPTATNEIFLSRGLRSHSGQESVSHLSSIHSRDTFHQIHERAASSVLDRGLSADQSSLGISSQGPLQHHGGSIEYGRSSNQSSFNGQMMKQEYQSVSGLDIYGPGLTTQVQASQPLPVGNQLYGTGSSSMNLPHQTNGTLIHQGMRLGPDPFDNSFLPQPGNNRVQHDTILPLGEGKISSTSGSSIIGHSSNLSRNFNHLSGLEMGNTGGSQSSFPFSGEQKPRNDQDIVNNMFGPRSQLPSQQSLEQPVDGTSSLVPEFSSLTFGDESNLGLDGAKWDWEGLMRDVNEDNTLHTPHRFGLGGVRLDNSSEAPSNRENANTSNSFWAM